jgi:EAL domain-containing protein (putative c-di-GMP-specific phosphodiesterase class I)/CheY-like chemotaxis protein
VPIRDLNFLVAEDHEFQRNALVWMLTGLGAHSIQQAGDGREALRLVNEPGNAIDVVISDLDMPGMDGMEFIRHLGQSGAQVSIILVSALEAKLLASIATMAGAYGMHVLGAVEKPLTPENLVQLIALHRRRSRMAVTTVSIPFALDDLLTGLRNDEFEPYFQPKIELATGRVCGAEALARWKHPEHGIIDPKAFIKTLEDSGFIDELTWVVLRKSATACSAWRDAGIDAGVSVNLSVRSLAGVKFAERVVKLARARRIDPQQMMLEVTESAATIDVGRALENLARLRMNGFGLSIDDYGTGYSSLQQLSRIAFTELKIDQSFVTGAGRSESSRVMLESSLEMARRLKLTSVAEGVETSGDLDLLCSLRCDLAQGFYIAPAMPCDEWIDWAKNWNPSRCRCTKPESGSHYN